MTKDGQIFTGISGEVTGHGKEVTGVLMSTPKKQQAPWHGGCSEIVCLDKAISAGVSPAGGKIKTINIGNKFGKKHKESKPACSSCSDVTDYFDVEVK